MDDALYDLIRQTAISAARCAGALQKEQFLSDHCLVDDSCHDLTSEIDRESSDVIMNHIIQAFPGHSILCEEEEYRGGEDNYLWIVDPLDGSVNYFLGLPYYCVSIACYSRMRETKIPVFGVVYAAATDELFTGGACEAASLNGKKLTRHRKSGLKDGILGVSLGSNSESFSHVYERLPMIFRNSKKVRSLGATALDLCRVASGGLSGLYQIGVKQWDFSAGEIILSSAGCHFGSKSLDHESYAIIAGNEQSIGEIKDVFGWKQGVML